MRKTKNDKAVRFFTPKYQLFHSLKLHNTYYCLTANYFIVLLVELNRAVDKTKIAVYYWVWLSILNKNLVMWAKRVPWRCWRHVRFMSENENFQRKWEFLFLWMKDKLVWSAKLRINYMPASASGVVSNSNTHWVFKIYHVRCCMSDVWWTTCL